MHVIDHRPPRASRTSRTTAFLIVLALHALVLLWLALERAGVFPPEIPAIEVTLFSGGGGGAPSDGAEATKVSARRAAPSSLHVPEVATPQPDSPAAPTETAPPTLIPPMNPGIEIAAESESAPSGGVQGLTGAGTGTGGGVGSGTGTGTGEGAGAGNSPSRWVRTLTPAERDAHYPRDAAHRRLSGQVVLNCVVYASTRIERCRVRSESPGGQGFGQAALQAVRLMRRQPPTVNGRVKSSHREDLLIIFAPPAAPAA
ncbi:TonB family protein [Brevundimonas sp.]|uniref:TonB family protein n=1 Tax=Brevundimonas sp. TaxID=1871086 RepID=UPI003F721B07